MNGHLANARTITRQLLCDNFRPEVASDVISGAFVEPAGVKVRVKFGNSRSNPYPDIRLPHFVRTTTTTTTPTDGPHDNRAKRLLAFCLKTVQSKSDPSSHVVSKYFPDRVSA